MNIPEELVIEDNSIFKRYVLEIRRVGEDEYEAKPVVHGLMFSKEYPWSPIDEDQVEKMMKEYGWDEP